MREHFVERERGGEIGGFWGVRADDANDRGEKEDVCRDAVLDGSGGYSIERNRRV